MTDQIDEAFPLITPGQLTPNSLVPVTGPGQPFGYFLQATALISSTAQLTFSTLAAFTGSPIAAPIQTTEVLSYATAGDLVGRLMQFKRVAGPLTQQNYCLYNRDLTNAAWTKTGCTAARTTGIDGISNSGSLLTATAPNATCGQVHGLGAQDWWGWVYIRRITGTGAIAISLDNGANYTDITAELAVSTAYMLFRPVKSGSANPGIQFFIATSGDAIAVDYVSSQHLVAGSSCPVPPAATAGTTSPTVMPWVIRSKDRFLPNGSTDDTNGGYWQLANLTICPEMFGAKADNTTDDWIAIQTAVICAYYYNVGSTTTGAIGVELPHHIYACSGPIEWIANGSFLHGVNIGQNTDYSQIRQTTETNGIRIWPGGQVDIRGVYLKGVNGNGNTYGIWAEAPFYFKYGQITNYSLDGIFFDGNTGAGKIVDRCVVDSINFDTIGRHVMNFESTDANINLIVNCRAANIGGSMIFSNASFGQTIIAPQLAGSGLLFYQTRTGVKGGVCWGSDNNAYMVKPGAETACSTSDPTTDGGVNWFPAPQFGTFGAPAINPAYIQTWSNGLTWQSAPAFYDGLYTAQSCACQLFNPYIEYPYSPPSIWQGLYSVSAGPSPQDGKVPGIHDNGFWNTTQGFYSSNGFNSPVGVDKSTVQIGGVAAGNNCITFTGVGGGSTLAYQWDTTHKDFNFVTLPSNAPVFGVTGAGTTDTFGHTAPVPYVAFFPQGISLTTGSSANARLLRASTTIPSTSDHAVGDFYFNTAPSATNGSFVFGWECTAHGAPDTWKPIYAAAVPIYAPCTFAQLPSASTSGAGARGYITDSNVVLSFGAIVSSGGAGGGGANKGPIYSDGTDWRYG